MIQNYVLNGRKLDMSHLKIHHLFRETASVMWCDEVTENLF